MQTENLIAVNVFCLHHNIELSFINSLQQSGLIELTIINDIEFIDATQSQKIEKIIRFYYELDINLEGIEAIIHLLQRLKGIQDEITALKNRIRFYEPNE